MITCVHHRNIYNIEELKHLQIESGVKKWRCFTIVPMVRAKGQEDLLLTNEKLRMLMDFIARTCAEGKINLSYACEGFLGDFEGYVRGHMYTCIGGLTVASVLSDDGISGCLSIGSQYLQGNTYMVQNRTLLTINMNPTDVFCGYIIRNITILHKIS